MLMDLPGCAAPSTTRKLASGYGTNVDVREHGIRIDANYAILVINVFSIEALGRRIFPSYNILDAAWPLLQTYRLFVYQSDGLEHVARVEL